MISPDNFRVIASDDHGTPVRCSYCVRRAHRVVVLPLTPRPELDDRVAASDGNELWLGLCADCVDAMRVALAGEPS